MRPVLLLAALLAALWGVTPALAGEAAPSPRIAEPATRAGTDTAQQEVARAIAAQVAARGSAELVVRTAVPFAPEALLTPSQAAVQRQEIARAAAALRSRLGAATGFEAYPDMPYVRLRVGAAGLAQLLAAPGVVRISEARHFNWMRDFVQLRTAVAAARHRGATAEGAAPRIVGGSLAAAGVHPFQVGLMDKAQPDNFKAQYCGGTLVADRYVVTAAHCSDMITSPSTQVQVLVKTRRLDGSGQRIEVSRVFVHPNWNAETDDYDAAVWVLARPVAGPYATLNAVQPTVAGSLLRVTGWGTLWFQGPAPVDMRVVDVPFVPTVNGACQSQTGVTGRMICAGVVGKDSCQGDSGGPLTRNAGAGYTVLTGIVSFGNGCALASFPGVYANVANPGIRSFLQSRIFVTLGYTQAGTGSGSVSFTANGATATCSASCARPFNLGRAVTLKAAAPVGSAFAGWSGAQCTGTAPCTLAMNAATAVTATFNKVATNAISYTRAGTGAGVVTFTPAGTSPSCAASCVNRFNRGQAVTLTATPAAGKRFVGWSGGGCSGTGACKVTMTADRAITATFR